MQAHIHLGRITIQAVMKLNTGVLIGASKDNLDIGGIDNLMIRDMFSNQPYIPGSALKGKFRSILEKAIVGRYDDKCPKDDDEYDCQHSYRTTAVLAGVSIRRHECCCAEYAKTCAICRLFGSSGKERKSHTSCEGTNYPAKLTVRDAFLTATSIKQLNQIASDLQYAEAKSENSVDRITGAANPRQMERVPKGAEFAVEFLYTIEPDFSIIDLHNLVRALQLLEEESGIGGSVTRGYGQVWFDSIQFSFSRNSSCKDSNGNIEKVIKEDLDELNIDYRALLTRSLSNAGKNVEEAFKSAEDTDKKALNSLKRIQEALACVQSIQNEVNLDYTTVRENWSYLRNAYKRLLFILENQPELKSFVPKVVEDIELFVPGRYGVLNRLLADESYETQLLGEYRIKPSEGPPDKDETKT